MIKLKVGLAIMGGGKYVAESLRPLIEEQGMELKIITEWDDADIKWDLKTWTDELKKFDILIAPIDAPRFEFKGNNRLTQLMSLGKPVLASPLDVYCQIIQDGVNGFVCWNDADWVKNLNKLKNKELRDAMGKNAYNSVKNKFSVKASTDSLLSAFKSVEDLLDIIIPNYNNTAYLLATLKSIIRNTYYPYAIHVVDSSSDDISEVEEFLKNIDAPSTFTKMSVRTNFATQINEGFRKSHNKWICVANNDLLFMKHWDLPLRNFLKAHPTGIIGPLSNCDNGWLHNYNFKTKKGLVLGPGIHELEGFDIEDLEESMPGFTRSEEIYRENVAYYCTLFSRNLVEKIGILDEDFQNGGEDFDFNYRAKKAGYNCYSVNTSFVFHFGGKTRKVSEKEDYDRHHREDDFNKKRLNKKLGKSVVALYLGPGWEKWDETSLRKGGIGGSETAAIWMGRELSKLYQVKIFADPHSHHFDEEGFDVEYFPWQSWDKFSHMHFIDFVISSRNVEPFHHHLHSYKNFVWVHDVFLNSNKNFDVCQEKVSYYFALSEWHKQFLHEHHGIPLNKILITSNGLDQSRYDKLEPVDKIPGQIFYSSSPDRGLDTLLYCSDFISPHVKDFKIKVAYGFNNWEKAVLWRNDANEIRKMEELKKALNKPCVEYLGRINQYDLAQLQLSSSGWFYSTRFHETHCITAVEAGYSRNPLLSSYHAGLETTVKDEGGILIRGDSYTTEYREKFVEESIKLLTNKEYWQEWSLKGRKRMERYTWKAVAEQWHRLFQNDEWSIIQH